jgi:hypothetical protein
MHTNRAIDRALARLALPGLLCLALFFGGAGTANALVVNWVDGTSFWDVVTNWSSGLLPSTTDDVVINVGGVPTITHRTGNTTIRTLSTSQPATVTVTNASSLTVTNSSTNTGIIRADGGSFNLFGSVVANHGGTIEAINNSVVQLTGWGGIAGGTLNTATGGVIRVVGSAGLNGETSWAGALTNNGLVEVSNGGVLGTAGTFNNNGTILLNSVGNATTFQFFGATTLQGSGTLTMGNNAHNFITGATATDRLTNTAGHTIQGSGNIGNSFMTMSNVGLILANQSTPLIIDMTNAANVLDSANGGLINTGTLRADGGTLILNDTIVHNAGGTVEALNGSVVQLQGYGISGGTLNTSGSGLIRVVGLGGLNGQTSWAGALTINGLVEVSNGSRLDTAGTLNNNGTILLNSSGNATTFGVVGATTLQGPGTLTMGNNAQNFITGATATDRLTNAVGHTIQGSGNIGNNFMAMSNAGLIVANQLTPLIIDMTNAADPFDPAAGGIINTGILRADGGTLRISDTIVHNGGGTVEAVNNSLVELGVGGFAAIHGGTVTTATGGVIRVVGGAGLNGQASRAGALINNGLVEVSNASRLDTAGTLNNNGTILLNSSGNATTFGVVGATTLQGPGTLTMGNNPQNFITGATATDRLTNAERRQPHHPGFRQHRQQLHGHEQRRADRGQSAHALAHRYDQCRRSA